MREGAKSERSGQVTKVDDLKKKRFLWGLLLAWLPWLPSAIGLANVFRGISTERATGLAVVAGGFTEMFLLIGLVAMMVFAIGAIVLLARAFVPGHWFRSAVGLMSMGFSALMILFIGLFCWMVAHPR